MQQIMKDQECNSCVETKRKGSNRKEWKIAANLSQDQIQREKEKMTINICSSLILLSRILTIM